MHFRKETEYAVRALLHLARTGSTANAEELSAVTSISPNVLRNIMQDFKKAGLVSVTRGSEGGYSLARRPHEITLYDVVTVTERKPAFRSTVSESARPFSPPVQGSSLPEIIRIGSSFHTSSYCPASAICRIR